MNYLGHLLVLPDSGAISLGNMLGDFFKGPLAAIGNPELRLGVALHREIDRFTDAHPAVRHSKSLISPPRRRIAAVLVDVFFDHFLAPTADLPALQHSLLPHIHLLPEELQPLPARMVDEQWFGAYRSVAGIAAVLARMDARRRRPLGLTGAEEELLANYPALAAALLDFYPDVLGFTRNTLERLESASLK